MKKIKLSLIAAMLVLVTVASAQVSLGVKGGLNMSNFSGDVNNNKAKVGFHIGLAADYEFMYNNSIQTGLFFTTKGSKFEAGIDGLNVKETFNPMYLQLPVHYAYKLDVSPGTRLVFHAGPYAALGLGGKAGDLKLFEDDILKRFDAGLGLGVGAEFGPILVDLGWDMGLVNISDIGGKIKNQNAYLSVGYKF